MKRKILVPVFASFMALSINSVAFANQDLDKTENSTETQDNSADVYEELSYKVVEVKEGTAVKIRKVGEVQEVAYEGDVLKVIGKQGDWYKVQLDEETVGWAPARYLELRNATAYINGDKVNFRSESNIESELYGELALGDSIKVIEEQDNWIKIEKDGKEGYIRSLYVSENKPEMEEEIQEVVQETSRSTSTRTSSNVSTNTSSKTEVKEVSTQSNTNYASSKASSIINIAYSKMGKPYVWGAEGPNSFDCSGFTSYAFRNGAGISLPRTSISQAGVGVSVSKGQLKPGDLVFFDSDRDGDISHVGIYVGGGQFIHASSSKGVTVSSLNSAFYSSVYKGAKRVL
jgi:peptidoglycan DL-endopeptidase CwlO